MRKIIFLTILIFFSKNILAQITIKGVVLDSKNQPIAGCAVSIKNSKTGTFTDSSGHFTLFTKKKIITLNLSFLGYETLDTVVNTQNTHFLKIILKNKNYEIEQVAAYGYYIKDPGTTYLRNKLLSVVPSASGNAVETLIMTSMGVQANNQMSSQYSVRGGNYNENLVYIDGIKIFRPILIRSGQQEGLSIINPDLVDNIKFSAGGFSAEYGDKMSSVLDITYRTPDTLRLSGDLGLLGGSFHIENRSKTGHFSYLTGIRIKQNSYLLNALPTKGNYKPFFSDFQTILNLNLTPKLSLRSFTYLSYNKYNFYPDSMTVALGTFTTNFKIPIYFQGQEKDKYSAALQAFRLRWKPKYNLQFNFLSSYYFANEQERYTLAAAYLINMVQNQFDKNSRDSIVNIGVGAYMNYGRNFLKIGVLQNTFRINYELANHSLVFGLEHYYDRVADQLTRWYYIDSAGYNFNPYIHSDSTINLYKFQTAYNQYSDHRFDVYLADYYQFFIGLSKLRINAGLRYIYWSYAGENQINPRISLYYTPNWRKKWTFRLSSGLYTQLPFYNDLRNLDGTLVSPEKAHSQKSIHFVLGAYRNFKLWSRPFRFTTEWYYKYLYDLIPFEFDNLRIQYYANQIAKGFAYGADFRLFGEFVPGTDSWISLSLLHTAEDIENDQYWQYYDNKGQPTIFRSLAVDSTLVEPGYIPRPTDQLVTIGLFFQDYMPQNKNMRVSLGLFYGSGRPYGPPGQARHYATLRMPAYLRADIGFLYIWKPKFAQSVIFEVDLFNAFDARNVASYSWLSVMMNPALINNPLGNVYMVQMAVPNYLTPRLINFKVKIKLK